MEVNQLGVAPPPQYQFLPVPKMSGCSPSSFLDDLDEDDADEMTMILVVSDGGNGRNDAQADKDCLHDRKGIDGTGMRSSEIPHFFVLSYNIRVVGEKQNKYRIGVDQSPPDMYSTHRD